MPKSMPALAALLYALVLCASGSVLAADKEKDDRIVVEFWHAMGGPEHSTLLNAWARDFEAENPDVHVVPVYQGDYNQLSQKLIASVIARSNPVMAQMYEGWTSRFLTRDLLDPVQNYFDGPYGMSREEIEDVWEPFRDNNTWNGTMVTFPFNKSCYVLYANLDMLRAAGYERPPETWDELREVSCALTVREPGKSTPKVYGFLMRPRIESFSVLAFRADSRFLSPDWLHAQANNPRSLEALRLLNAMVATDRTAYFDSSYPAIPFGSGQVAMYIHSSAAFPFNDRNARGKFQWIAAPVPHPEGRRGGILFQGTNIGIFARPHPPQVREAAWRFLKFMTDTENAARWSIDTGYVAIRRSSTETPEMREFLEKNPNYRVPISLIPEATFDPRPHYWDQMRLQIQTYAIEAINGKRTPDEALRLIDEKLQEIIDYEMR
ncbi:ABC transporter substrate-binding protein [Candidatus Sumerlaeota bacterium]|nr:ABC transporter substrate-binding protein [Candidatus Sumerlaeota bacterium]